MNKTVLIFGASQGIGKELVLQFAKESNTTVLALSRNIDLMNKNFNSKQIHSYQFDLATENRKSALTAILQNYSHIDIVINNAGLLINKPFLELTSDEIINSYRVNVVSVMECTQMVVPLMEKDGGHIVNISSMGGFQGSVKFPGLSAYASSKAALASFTEIFAEEFKDSKIRMNCLCLGATQTEMLEKAFPGYQAPISASRMASYIHHFANTGDEFLNGKILPVSLSTP
jgi:3-oxoacyl-[acyl-carrier protein] reductase